MARFKTWGSVPPRVLAVGASQDILDTLRQALAGGPPQGLAGPLLAVANCDDALARLRPGGGDADFAAIVCDAGSIDGVGLEAIAAQAADAALFVAGAPGEVANLRAQAPGAAEGARELVKPLPVDQAKEQLETAAAAWRERRGGGRDGGGAEGFFQRLVERSADAFLYVTPDQIVQYASPGIEGLTGYAPREVEGRSVACLLHPRARRRGLLAFAKQLRDRVPALYYEFPAATKTGPPVWGGVTVQLLMENGQPIGFQACARDVTRRRDALEAAKREEAAWRAVVESIGDGIRVLDGDRRVTRANASLRAHFPGAGPLDGDTRRRASEDSLGAASPAAEALAAGEMRAAVVPHPGGGEAERWLELRAYPMRDGQGAVRGVVEHLRDITAGKEAEDALRQSEARFRNAYLNAPVMLFAVNESGVIVSANRAFSERLGYEPPEIAGKELRAFLASEDAAAAAVGLRPRLWQDGRLRNVRLDFAQRDGHALNAAAHAVAACGETGEPTVFFALTDETERRCAEEAAETSRTFLDAVSDAIIIVERASGRIVKVNDRFREVFGYHGSETGALSLSDLNAEPGAPDDLLEAFAGGGGVSGGLVEWQARTKEGRLFWVEANTRLIEEAGPPRLVAALRDVTERKQTELELTRLRAAVEDTSAAVLITETSGSPTYFNMAFGNLFGYTRQQAGEVDFAALFLDPASGRSVLKAIHAGQSWEGELRMRSREGREFPAYLRGAPILDDLFEVAGLAFVLNNMTERKQMEAQLLQSQNIKSIGQLAAGIAHEINTPMQFVGDNTRFLKDSFEDLSKVLTKYGELLAAAQEGPLAPDTVEAAASAVEEADVAFLAAEIPEAISQTLEGVERVTTIVRAMRQFTHPGTDGKTMVDLNDAVRSTATVAQNEYKYVAGLEFHLDEELPAAPCLRGDLNQVILNLLVNAAHAIEEAGGGRDGGKGVITVTTSHDADFVELRIGDTGPGIPPEIQERVFDPFFTTKEVGKGTGQGLAISHAVVAEKHGGTLTFETKPGEGTEFIIRLPRRDPGSHEGAGGMMESADADG